MARNAPANISDFPDSVKQKSNKTSKDISASLSIGEKAAIGQLTRLFGMPGLAGDALRLLIQLAKTTNVATEEKNLYLLFLVSNAEVESRKLRTP